MNRALSYSDVYLIPQYSPASSRGDISTEVEFGDMWFKSPIVPANMLCTISADKAKWLSENGYFYVMHRFFDRNDATNNRKLQTDFVVRMNDEGWGTKSVSLGVQRDDIEMVRQWCQQGYKVDFITIDIAHADSIRAKEALEEIVLMRDYYAQRFFIIVGNVATPQAVQRLTEWGADAVKVGIAQGGACTTYGKTGFGMPMFTCMMDCSEVAKVPLIADGGIKTNGDIAKAIRAGGTMVMAGSMFAACIDSPAESVYGNARVHSGETGVHEYKGSITHKQYFGSASSFNKGNHHHVEGTLVTLPVDPLTYAQKVQEITEDLQSACSYAGGSMERLAVVPWGVR